MSLNYDLSKVPSRYAFKGDDIHPVTDRIIWGMMLTGMAGELTAKRVPELYARMRVMDETGNRPIKPLAASQIAKRVGLKTEVTNFGLSHLNGETRAQFVKRLLGGNLDDYVRDAKRELQE